MKLIIVGGKNRSSAHSQLEWARHEAGIVARLNLGSGKFEKLLEYSGNKNFLPDDPLAAVTFKAGTLLGKELWACTTTELLSINLDSCEIVKRLSHPSFNDLHHVVPNPFQAHNTLLVANTGLDMCQEIDLKQNIVNEWSVIKGGGWDKYDRDIDYRKVESTKPHLSHPNYVFTIDQEIWATRFLQKDAICLTDARQRPFVLEHGNIHDGIVRGGVVWFTSVNGYVSAFDIHTRERLIDINLNVFHSHEKLLGWCRAVEIVDDDHLAVGYSRLRPTKFRENIKWLTYKTGFRSNAGTLPTRIEIINFKKRTLEGSFDVEPIGLNAVFSVHLEK